MNKAINNNLIIFGAPIILLIILIWLMKSSFLATINNTLDLAITVDLLFTVPIVYFLLIRKTQIPKTTVIILIIIGLLLGYIFLPKENQFYLDIFKTWVLPFIEIFILVFVIFKVKNAIKKYKNAKGEHLDFFTALKKTCYEVLPKKVAMPFATEIAVIYYGFIKWKTPKLKQNEFTYHKNSGTPMLLGAFIFIILIETFVLHVALQKWNVIVAWILTGVSIYTIIQVLGFAKSLIQRPIYIDNNFLWLKYGILNEAKISLTNIDEVELSKKPLPKEELTKTLSPLGELESYNVIIHLKDKTELIGLYGFSKKFTKLQLYVDKPNKFKEAILSQKT